LLFERQLLLNMTVIQDTWIVVLLLSLFWWLRMCAALVTSLAVYRTSSRLKVVSDAWAVLGLC